jgi:hypothetical protein
MDNKAAGLDEMRGGMETIQDRMLAELVADGCITQADAYIYADVHDRLAEAGFME